MSLKLNDCDGSSGCSCVLLWRVSLNDGIWGLIGG